MIEAIGGPAIIVGHTGVGVGQTHLTDSGRLLNWSNQSQRADWVWVQGRTDNLDNNFQYLICSQETNKMGAMSRIL